MILLGEENHLKAAEINNLPDPNPSLVTRYSEVTQIHSLLKAHSYVAIVGMAGMGKTQLARLFAYQYHQEYDLIWWFDAKKNVLDQLIVLIHELNHKKLLPQIETNALNFSILYKRLYSQLYTHKKKALLIFDNVEDYFDIHPFFLIREDLQNSPVHIILTSRADSGYESILKINSFSQAEAEEFLRNLLPRRSLGDISSLAKGLNYYPLSLGQSAMYLRQHPFITVPDYLKLYHQQITKLWQSEENLLQTTKLSSWDEQHQSVSATLQLSIQEIIKHRELSIDLLIFLSIIGSQNIPSSLLKSWCDVKHTDDIDFGESLSNLVKYNLVSAHYYQEGKESAYSIHDAVQKVVITVFAKSNLNEKYDKAAKAFLKLLTPHKNHLISFYEANAALTGHMITLIKNAEINGFSSPALTAIKVYLLDYYLYVRRDHQVALKLIEIIQNDIKAIKSEPLIYARFISSQGDVICLHNANNPTQIMKTLKIMEAVLDDLRKNPNPDIYEIVRLLNNLGQGYLLRGDPHKAEIFLLDAYKYASLLKENGALVPLFYFLTWLYIDKGDFVTALKMVDQAVNYMSNQPNTAIKFYVCNFKALCLLSLKKFTEAAETASLSVELCRNYFEDYKTDTLAEALTYQATAYFYQGNIEKAKRSIEEAINIYKDFYKGEFKILDQAFAYATLGDIFTKEEDYLRARNSYLTAFKVFEACSEKMQVNLANQLLSKLALNAFYLGEPCLTRKYFKLHQQFFDEETSQSLFNKLTELGAILA